MPLSRRTERLVRGAWLACACTLAASMGALVGLAQVSPTSAQAVPTWAHDDREIASRFAPVFHQGLVGSGRFDYITNIDFDGDWVGDNNWQHAADQRLPLRAYVYYAVSETPTHYFVHYAAFHPRDYKGGEVTGAVLSQAVRRGAQASKRVLDTPLADELVLAHENDLEGCLVVAARRGAGLAEAEVVLVETLAHNQYLKYVPGDRGGPGLGRVRMEGQHPLIYIEPKGHGMEALPDESVLMASAPVPPVPSAGPAAGNGFIQRMSGLVTSANQVRKALNGEGAESVRVYRFTGAADDPDAVPADVGYDLVSTYHTLWAHARDGNETLFGDARDYGEVQVRVSREGGAAVRSVRLGRLGASLRGLEGARNMARPPWGWFDAAERDRPMGEWFLDPAATVVRHVPSLGDVVDPAYVHQPFLDVFRGAAPDLAR